MTSTAAQSASSADLILLWRLIVRDQVQHRMKRDEFIAFYKLMGTFGIVMASKMRTRDALRAHVAL